MSRQDKLTSPMVIGSSVTPMADGRLQIDLRLELDDVAAAEEVQLRSESARRRPTPSDLVAIADCVVKARQTRGKVLGAELFGEPAWDMLLALYLSRKRHDLIGPTSLSHCGNVPETTGLRYQKMLMDDGLIERGPHQCDLRRQIVRLTPKGQVLMEQYLTRLFDSIRPAPPK